MKYFTAKSLAALCIAAVLFIICFNLAVGTTDNTAGSTTAYNLSSWLAKHGVTIDRELIDTDDVYAVDASMKNAYSDRASAAEAMLKNASSSGADTYTGENGAVSFSHDSFVLTPAHGLFEDIFSGLDRYNCGRRAEDAANELGFDLNGSVISSEETDGGFKAVITKTIDSAPVFNDCITLTMSRDGLISAEGVWFVPEELGEKRRARPAADALGDLLNRVEGAGKITVRSMEFGYLMERNGRSARLKPVWRFELDGRDDVYTDA